MPGQEGIPSVFSPMARTLNDLTYFTRAIIGMKPWKYDHSVHPISWRDEFETEAQSKPLRIGLMATDGMSKEQSSESPANDLILQVLCRPLRPLNAQFQQPSLL